MNFLPEKIILSSKGRKKNRDLIPDDTFVLVGFFNSEEQYQWIKTNKLYNFRMGSGAGSLVLDKETVSSKYLLFHTTGDTDSGNLWKNCY